MSIDAQRMFRVLELACNKAGVEILQGLVRGVSVVVTEYLRVCDLQRCPITCRARRNTSSEGRYGWHEIGGLSVPADGLVVVQLAEQIEANVHKFLVVPCHRGDLIMSTSSAQYVRPRSPVIVSSRVIVVDHRFMPCFTRRTAAASLVYGSEGSSVDAVLLEDGRHLHVNAVVSATGAWMRELMPVPMLPHKGQMMSLREPVGGQGKGSPQQGGGIGLTRVFFAAGCYIIPKRDGRIVVGSTVEVR